MKKINIEKILQIITVIICSFILALLIDYKGIDAGYSSDRILIFSSIFSFIGLHLVIDKKKIWEFIHKKRYLIFLIVLTISVMGKYHISSISEWNNYVDPGHVYTQELFGESRAIRSDEWLVSTPSTLSQEFEDEPYNETNDILTASDITVNLYPKLPVNNYTVITDLSYLGFLFLPQDYAFSFMMMFEFLALILISYEFIYILTKKKKLISLLGAIMIGLAPTVMWWSGIIWILYGEAAIVLLYYFINAKKTWQKLLISLAFSIVALNYITAFYPAWQLILGYLYATIAIYYIVKNWQKLHLRDLKYLLLVIFIICIVFVPVLLQNIEMFEVTANTVYPGERMPITGADGNFLFNYISSNYYSVKEIANPSENSQFFSLYPLPIIISLVNLFKARKNKKEDSKKTNKLITTLSIFVIIMSIWNFIPIPEIITKITFLSYSTPYRSQIIVSYATLLILLLLFAEYGKERKFKLKEVIGCFTLSTIFSVIVIYITYNYPLNIFRIDNYNMVKEFLNLKIIITSFIGVNIMSFVLIYNNEKLNKYAFFIMSFAFALTGLIIAPLAKGTDVIYEKPTAHAIQRVVESDPKAKWISLNSIVLQQYLIANGAKTINSVNYFPQLELWKIIDENEEFKEVYNRYAHITIDLTNDNSWFELLRPDAFKLYLNYEDVCKLDIEYLLTTSEINHKNFTKIDNGENTLIYQVSCKND